MLSTGRVPSADAACVTGDPHVPPGEGEDGNFPAISGDEDVGLCAWNGCHEALQAVAFVVSKPSWRGGRGGRPRGACCVFRTALLNHELYSRTYTISCSASPGL